jgi:cell division septation protein DedD
VPQVQTPPDTVDATVRRPAEPIATPPPPEVPQTLPRPPVVPRFGVQIGAYTQPDVAQRIATLAKSRFPVKLQQILDRNSEMTKIYLGEFSSKDDARKFRDTIVRQFPGEYDDAWVSEIPQQ